MYSDITGIILAGGKSVRMGENKSLLKLNGKTAIGRTVDLMKSVFENVLIITNTPEEYSFLDLPKFKDIYEYKGPLAGIHSGLTHSKTERNFIISCDIPLMKAEMIRYIVDFKTEKPITVCRADGFIQQLAGRYSKSVLREAEEFLKENETETRAPKQSKRKCKVHSLLNAAGAEIINAEELDFYDEYLFFNMNRKEDYEKIVDKLGGR
ncbi:MAG: molybdenum cofactor guanylyltransferase [Chlorobi bacterium]|nr:molybdenum cofactor guanylyltransferase [Chlorobiota bacterium]